MVKAYTLNDPSVFTNRYTCTQKKTSNTIYHIVTTHSSYIELFFIIFLNLDLRVSIRMETINTWHLRDNSKRGYLSN